jgi:hypothetical protein
LCQTAADELEVLIVVSDEDQDDPAAGLHGDEVDGRIGAEYIGGDHASARNGVAQPAAQLGE